MPVSQRTLQPQARLYCCKFQDLECLAGIDPGSVQLVLTDPPYERDWLRYWYDLAQLAHRLLVEGGILVTYTGKLYASTVIEALGTKLTYRWMIASVWAEETKTVRILQAEEQWRLILVYSKGKWIEKEVWCDVLRTQKDKMHHKWQQPLQEAEQLLFYFSSPGDLVVDPCAGSFTVAEACTKLRRRCIACDAEQSCLDIGNERLRRLT